MTAAALTASNPSPGRTLFKSMATDIGRCVHFKLQLSSSYPTGGETADFVGSFPGLVPGVPVVVVIPAKSGYTFTWSASTKKILAYTTATTEVTNTTDLSTTPGIVDVLVFCP